MKNDCFDSFKDEYTELHQKKKYKDADNKQVKQLPDAETEYSYDKMTNVEGSLIFCNAVVRIVIFQHLYVKQYKQNKRKDKFWIGNDHSHYSDKRWSALQIAEFSTHPNNKRFWNAGDSRDVARINPTTGSNPNNPSYSGKMKIDVSPGHMGFYFAYIRKYSNKFFMEFEKNRGIHPTMLTDEKPILQNMQKDKWLCKRVDYKGQLNMARIVADMAQGMHIFYKLNRWPIMNRLKFKIDTTWQPIYVKIWGKKSAPINPRHPLDPEFWGPKQYVFVCAFLV